MTSDQIKQVRAHLLEQLNLIDQHNWKIRIALLKLCDQCKHEETIVEEQTINGFPAQKICNICKATLNTTESLLLKNNAQMSI